MNSVPFSFWQWLSTFDSIDQLGAFALLVAIGGGALVAIVAMVCFMVHRIHRARLEDTLKRDLLDRGMTADEIATIVRAAPTKGSTPPAVLPHDRRNLR